MMPFILVSVGLFLIFIEFFLPGGLLAVLGGLALIAGVIYFIAQSNSPLSILFFLAATSISLIFIIRFALWRVVQTKTKGSFYLEKDQEGFMATTFDASLVGKVGIVSTDLHPGGHIEVEGRKHLAISTCGYIMKGEKVSIIGGEGESLFVKHCTEKKV